MLKSNLLQEELPTMLNFTAKLPSRRNRARSLSTTSFTLPEQQVIKPKYFL
jgi:hypothetical protein